MNNFKGKIAYKNFLLPIIIILLAINTQAQVYSIGDTVESLQAKSMINWPQQEFKYQKGKALILDFWATWCSPCIAEFPKTDSLKNKFAKDLDVIAVTSDKNELVAKFLSTYKKNFGITITSVTDDQLLKRNFPHLVIPHYVWINKKGVVSAITTPEHLNDENVRKLIAGEKLTLPVKNEYEDVATHKVLSPLVEIDEKRGFPALRSYYYLGKYQSGTQSFSTAPMYDKTTNTNRIRAINISLAGLYTLAYLGLENFHISRVIYEGFEELKKDQITKENYFSYDQIIPGDNVKEAYAKMKKFLDMELGATSTLETRRMECLVLKKGRGLRLSPANSKAETVDSRDSTIKNNVPLENLLSIWAFGDKPLFPLDIVDETGLDKRQRISISLALKDKNDVEALITAFKKQGLILTREFREMAVIVLKKK
ncbi:TlpA disulfide reductase family protein [Chryseobacterium shandongense]|uniref:Thioredoxin domain-containing protein n=1 Tax=Chryseobacterium shandongense TaxID=1493872 RepID=A0ABM7BA44_9FLAO|nr:TlpA disulfide reductase family protein [Chryseobacterium shandongense]AZA95613.1 hypothetical protein EG353_08560 [Chryseobacterium shandongense]